MMKKIFTVLMMTFVTMAATFAYDQWCVRTVWPNTDPVVVKTMPSVKNFAKENGFKLNFKSADTLRTDVNLVSLCLNVKRIADKILEEYPELGQYLWYDSDINIFILINYKNGEYQNMFVAEIEK